MQLAEKLLYELFETIPQKGPGDLESTVKAFNMVTDLPEEPEILDIGCGEGRQTFDLARITHGQITAVDIFPGFIQKLQNKADKNQYLARIRSVQGDMTDLQFAPDSFDLIWSEGSAYEMGFENALHKWRPLLKPNGSMVLSEIVFFKKNHPQEIADYWANEIPDMKYFADNFSIIEAAGYKLVAYFALPDEAWWTDYYTPVKQKIAEMRSNYQDIGEANEFFDAFEKEIKMHQLYSKYYGYGFYILKRIEA
ncbi:Uncharacterized protein CHISP_1465 [Chitinispirillum alkaliphilum]|nr:Uncharacterized protein CHISP_1465 [Chitinispirillum alkaliphilum]